MDKIDSFPNHFVVSDDIDRGDLVRRIQRNPNDMVIIRKWTDALTLNDIEEIELWVDRHEESDLARKKTWIFLLLDELGLLPQDRDWDAPHKLIRQLSRFGSYRLSSLRMTACRHIASVPGKYKVAIPVLLVCAESDPDVRVRAWAAVALQSLGDASKDWLAFICGLHVPGNLNNSDKSSAEMAISSARGSAERCCAG